MRTTSIVVTLAALLLVAQDARAETLLLATDQVQALADAPGLRLRSCRSGLCTADVLDDDALRGLHHHLIAVEPSRGLRPALTASVPAAGVTNELRDLGFDGEGVLVIVIDSGIDWRHDDFRDGEGGCRIEAIVDFSLEPAGIHPLLEAELGVAFWDRADIEAHLAAETEGWDPAVAVHSRDTFGHGTHVASIAAGSRGVAPAADLIAIRASRDEWPVVFDDADVLDAARFAFGLARQLDRPAVLVLALGGHNGPHDGTSLLEAALADLVGPDEPGRAIVVAAGNSGGADEHASGDPTREPVDVVIDITSEDESLAVDLELWSAPESELQLSLTTPEGETLGPIDRGGRETGASGSAWLAIDNASSGRSMLNGDLQALVSLRNQLSGAILPGEYRLTVSGRGHFDAYLTWSSAEQMWNGARLTSALDPDGTLTVPGTSPELITVGASVSRRAWTDIDGRSWLDDRYTNGMVAPYSGSGPTRSGSLSPDLVAPGHVIIAALSGDARPPAETSVFTPRSWLSPERSRIAPPGDRAVLWGTSAATPHVAGVVALLLQLDPNLTQGELASILTASARTNEGAAGRAWSPRWGYGELDAEAAIKLARDGFTATAVSADASAFSSVDDVVAAGDCTTLVMTPKNAEGHPVGPGRQIEIRSTAEPVRTVIDEGNGFYQARWCADSQVPRAEVTFVAVIDSVELEQEVIIRVAPNRRDLGGWLTAGGGGCSVQPGFPDEMRQSVLSLLGLREPALLHRQRFLSNSQ